MRTGPDRPHRSNQWHLTRGSRRELVQAHGATPAEDLHRHQGQEVPDPPASAWLKLALPPSREAGKSSSELIFISVNTFSGIKCQSSFWWSQIGSAFWRSHSSASMPSMVGGRRTRFCLPRTNIHIYSWRILAFSAFCAAVNFRFCLAMGPSHTRIQGATATGRWARGRQEQLDVPPAASADNAQFIRLPWCWPHPNGPGRGCTCLRDASLQTPKLELKSQPHVSRHGRGFSQCEVSSPNPFRIGIGTEIKEGCPLSGGILHCCIFWCPETELNRRHMDFQSIATLVVGVRL